MSAGDYFTDQQKVQGSGSMLVRHTVSYLSHSLSLAQGLTTRRLSGAIWHEQARHVKGVDSACLDLPLMYASSTTFTGRRRPFSPDSSS